MDYNSAHAGLVGGAHLSDTRRRSHYTVLYVAEKRNATTKKHQHRKQISNPSTYDYPMLPVRPRYTVHPWQCLSLLPMPAIVLIVLAIPFLFLATKSTNVGETSNLTPNLSYRIVYRTVSCRTIPQCAVPHGTIPHRTLPYRTSPYHTVPCTTPYLTVPQREKNTQEKVKTSQVYHDSPSTAPVPQKCRAQNLCTLAAKTNEGCRHLDSCEPAPTSSRVGFCGCTCGSSSASLWRGTPTTK